ncbi:MAG: hypothetical protein ACI9BS_001572, partial [Candidatus Poriferisodalaceae bacterium]
NQPPTLNRTNLKLWHSGSGSAELRSLEGVSMMK